MAQLGCGMAQLVACWAAGRRPPSLNLGSAPPLPELAAMKKLERISANVMNECVLMNLYECTVNDEEKKQ
jgi:hypothetical protein